MMLSNNEYVYTPDDVRELYWRKLIDEDTAKAELARNGLDPSRIDLLMGTWNRIPSTQDILWMVGKEAFEPDQIQVFGLDDKFPEDQVEWLEKQGLSRFWAEKYWIAHWTPPSLQLGFEMYHRSQLDDHELDLLFQLHEIPPFFRPKLKAISYRLLTRVDVRRMYRAGEIDAQKVFDTYKGSGYSNEDAQSMTNWVIAEYSPEQKELTRSQVELAYADGQLT